jgi:hypothetical protein
MHRRVFAAILVALLTLAVAPARATDTHEYASGEYAVVRDGLAPDKTKSLASHGDGGGGSGHFHVWLMAEPAHRKITALDDIGEDNILDTGPGAYHAVWSKDSRHVAVGFRSDRHIVEMNLYQVDGGRARRILGPDLFKDVTSREVGSGDDLRSSVPEFEWSSESRFRLREHRLFLTTDPGFVRLLGPYGRIKETLDDGRLSVEFSAEADCVVMPGNRYRIVDLRVGKFRDGEDW